MAPEPNLSFMIYPVPDGTFVPEDHSAGVGRLTDHSRGDERSGSGVE